MPSDEAAGTMVEARASSQSFLGNDHSFFLCLGKQVNSTRTLARWQEQNTGDHHKGWLTCSVDHDGGLRHPSVLSAS